MTPTEPTLYVVATSHLDTQWRWTFQDTAHRYLPLTLEENFKRFEKFPNYTFSFEGSYRYLMAKRLYPELYERLKASIRQGRWRVCGASVDAGDTNTVAPESLIRHALYGNGFFREEFGVESGDLFLPDCFGFSWVLPTVAAHCGLVSFSTSKLEWGSSEGIPFDVGMWEGVDGSAIVACIDPGQYSHPIKKPIHEGDRDWAERMEKTRGACGAPVALKYFGLGDTGGAPDEASLQFLEEAIAQEDGFRVVSTGPDQLARDLTEAHKAALPRHCTEFLLIEHGVGTFTAAGAMKRWNRRNEHLADAAERAALFAELLGGPAYPRETLREAWTRLLANQMHDILPGSSIPEAYTFSWNDEGISASQFLGVIEDSLQAVAGALDTNTRGIPVLVFNPLEVPRQEVVELELGSEFPLSVYTPEEQPVPAQRSGDGAALCFPVSLGPMEAAIYEIRSGDTAATEVALRGTPSRLENERLLAEVDAEGNLSRLYDKKRERELLAGPIRFEFLRTAPREWPAWTLVHDDLMAPPREVLSGPAEIRLVENGPLRQRLRVERTQGPTRVVQWFELPQTPGAAWLDMEIEIRWETSGRCLKLAFPMPHANPRALYDLGTGVIERGVNHPRLHEVPAQQWAAQAHPEDGGGLVVYTDCKYGWDKPDDHTLRLTLLHTPELVGFNCHLGGANFVDHFREQGELDFGRHRMRVRLAGFDGDPRTAGLETLGRRLNMPVLAAPVTRHSGTAGRRLSLGRIGGTGVVLTALKKAERADAIIARLHNQSGGSSIEASIELGGGVHGATPVNGMEDPAGERTQPEDGRVQVTLPRYRPTALALDVRPFRQAPAPATSLAIALPHNHDAVSLPDNMMDGDMDGEGHSLPGDRLPATLVSGPASFKLGNFQYREKNCLVPEGQQVSLPDAAEGTFLYLLAASVQGDADWEFGIGDGVYTLAIHDYTAPVAQWDQRVVNGRYVTTVDAMKPGFVKDVRVAWTCLYRHSRRGNCREAYERCSLYRYVVGPLPGGAATWSMGQAPRVRLFAASLVGGIVAPVTFPLPRMV